MDLHVIQHFIKKVQEIDTLFQEMQTLKQQEVGLKLLTSLLKRNETRLGGRFKMKTVIWYSMKEFEKFYDISYKILFDNENGRIDNDEFDKCLSRFSISDFDIVQNMEQIVRKLALQFDAIETTLDYNEDYSVIDGENDSNDYIMGIDTNSDKQDGSEETALSELDDNFGKDFPIDNSQGKVKETYDHNLDSNCGEITYCYNLEANNTFNNETNSYTNERNEEPYDNTHAITDSRDEVHASDKEDSTEICDKTDEKDKKDDNSCMNLPDRTEQDPTLYFGLDNVELSTVDDETVENGLSPVTSLQEDIDVSSESSENDTQVNNNINEDNCFVVIDENELKKKSHDHASVEDINVCREKYKPVNNIPKVQNHIVEIDTELIKKDPEYEAESQKGHSHYTRWAKKRENTQTKHIKVKEESQSEPTGSTHSSYSTVSENWVKTKTYSCKLCDTTFSREKVLYKHYRKHKEGKFCCLTCGDFHDSLAQLTDHIKKHEQRTNLKCQHCGELFKTPSQYKTHLAGHQSYPCHLYDKRLPTPGSLARHKNLVHELNDSKDAVAALLFSHQCEMCEARFTKETNYLVHKAKHTGEKPYSCEVCNLFFTKHQSFLKHQQTVKHNLKVGNSDGERRFLCQQCGKAFLRKDALKRHEKQHTSEKRHMCQFCGFKCRETSNLKRHIALHFESQRNFVCEICGAAFHVKKTLEVHHQFKHSDERKFLCTHCKMAFKAKSTLIRHMKVHSQSKNHTCWCGTSFKTLYNLRRHMNKLHGGDSKLPPVKYVQTLDCPVKNKVSKTDFHSKYEDQSFHTVRGDNYDQPDEQNADNEENAIHNISFEGENDSNKPIRDTTNETAIPAINTFRRSVTVSQEDYSIDNLHYDKIQDKDIGVHETVNVSEEMVDDSSEAYANQNQLITPHSESDIHLADQTAETGKLSIPQFSLYGYPPPYNSTVPQFMYMQPGLPRYEPVIPTSTVHTPYEQLFRFGPVFSTNTLQPVTNGNNNLTLPVSRLVDTEESGAVTPGLSQEQLKILHHEIYSRLTQEEISQRLNSEAYRQSLSQIDNTESRLTLKAYNESLSHSAEHVPSSMPYHPSLSQIVSQDQAQNSEAYSQSLPSQVNNTEQSTDNVQSSVPFNYDEKSDCAYGQTGSDKMAVSAVESKQTMEPSHESMYECSIDADYLQSRREMAAESLALMSALTPESVYNNQEMNSQML